MLLSGRGLAPRESKAGLDMSSLRAMMFVPWMVQGEEYRMSYKRKVDVPFEGEDGYTVDGTAKFSIDIGIDGEVYIEEESLVVRLRDTQLVNLDSFQRKYILEQLESMSDDIQAEYIRDGEESRAESMNDPF